MKETKETIGMCDKKIIHKDIIEKVKREIIDDNTLNEMGELFKVFGDTSRLKILNALLISEMCVCDISDLLHMNQPAISHHLKVLKQARLIKYRKDGVIAYYSLAEEHIKEVYLIKELFMLVKKTSDL